MIALFLLASGSSCKEVSKQLKQLQVEVFGSKKKARHLLKTDNGELNMKIKYSVHHFSSSFLLIDVSDILHDMMTFVFVILNFSKCFRWFFWTLLSFRDDVVSLLDKSASTSWEDTHLSLYLPDWNIHKSKLQTCKHKNHTNCQQLDRRKNLGKRQAAHLRSWNSTPVNPCNTSFLTEVSSMLTIRHDFGSVFCLTNFITRYLAGHNHESEVWLGTNIPWCSCTRHATIESFHPKHSPMCRCHTPHLT
jgi:hypothetical protein